MSEGLEGDLNKPQGVPEVFVTKEEALNALKEFKPSLPRRFYFKDGQYIGSEPVDLLSKEPADWFDSRTKSDEFIDAISEPDVIQDTGEGDWYIGYRNPKDPQFKGKVLEHK